MDSLVQDLRLAFRSLRRAPAYTFGAVIALALAIGANTALFSLIEAVLLRPFPYPQPEQVLLVRETSRGIEDVSVSYPNFVDWRAQTGDVFSDMAAFRRESFNLTGEGDADRVAGRQVTAAFLRILGMQPSYGRDFEEADDKPGAQRTVLLTNELWRRRFASDPRIVGKQITLTGDSYTVIGVLPLGYRFLAAVDVLVPLGLWADAFGDRDEHPGISVVARLRPGATLQQARATLNGVAERLEKQYPRTNTRQRVQARQIQEDQTADFRTQLLMLWGAVAAVLLIAAANVASLMLARGAARASELAIRAALGAGRRRLVRTLLTESVLLALAGGAAGVVLALWGVAALVPLLPEGLRRNADIRVDGFTLLFTFGLSLATGVAFGVLPALRASRPDLETVLRSNRSTGGPLRVTLRSALVVAEIALSLSLLIGAGLLLRSFARMAAVDPGFEPRHVVSAQLQLPTSRYRNAAALIRFEQELRRRVAALPGVRAAAVSRSGPFLDDSVSGGLWIEGRAEPPPSEGITSVMYAATPGFLQALGTPILRGRDLDERDDLEHPAVLVDDEFARKVFGHEDPIGHRLVYPGNTHIDKHPEIVGVYRHVEQYGLDGRGPVSLGAVVPYRMLAEAFPLFGAQILFVRTEGDPLSVIPLVRREVQRLDPELPVFNVRVLESAVDDSLAPRRFALMLLGIFAAVALVLATVGVYGVMSYAVVQRTREIGIRMALGAAQRDVLRMVVGNGAKLAVAGVAAGLLLAFGLSRVLSGMLFAVSAIDPLTYAAIAAGLAGVALLASWLPARRAARVDPNVALRAE